MVVARPTAKNDKKKVNRVIACKNNIGLGLGEVLGLVELLRCRGGRQQWQRQHVGHGPRKLNGKA